MGLVIGQDCKAYYSTTGMSGTPTWVELTIATDVTWEPAYDEAEASSRASRYKKYLAGMLDVPVTIEILRVLGNTQYEALRDAFKARTTLGLCIAGGDRTASGVEMFTGDFVITGWAVSEPLAEGSKVSVTFKLDAKSANEPTYDEAA